MKVTTHQCDLCQNIVTGPMAQLTAPAGWAAGNYAPPAPKESSEIGVSIRMFSMFSMDAEPPTCRVDVCAACFHALFASAAWLRTLVETNKVPR